jgi:broad specificity phosphatase PhoE
MAAPRGASSGQAAVLLIEHGQTAMDRAHRVHGDKDVPLTEAGRSEAATLGKRLKAMARPPFRLFTSPRQRAVETATIAGRIAGIPVKVEAALAPLAIGRFAGGKEKEVAEQLKPYFDNPNRAIPGGERVADWQKRHLGFMARVAAKATGGRTPAVVSHSNVIGSILAVANGAGDKDRHDARSAMAHPPKAATPKRIMFPINH